MAEIVYSLCGVGSVLCAWMLMRGYRKDRSQLLLWSSICFGFLALNNIVLVFDLVLLPEIEFSGSFWRNMMAAIAGSTLLYGLIGELT